jgi:NADPH:quinone reductase
VLAATRLKESGLGQTQHLPAIVNALAPQGALALIDDPDSLDIVPFKRKSLSVHWELMFTRSLFGTPNMDQQHRLLTEVGAGTLSAYELQRI